ncbi:hypothetical protein [Thermoproteus uzoniensis]|nr:hypothetical protein [Thermoproteus uzoniensis]
MYLEGGVVGRGAPVLTAFMPSLARCSASSGDVSGRSGRRSVLA